MKLTKTLFIYLTFSIIAALLLIFLVVTTPSHTSSLSTSEKGVIASVLILCCCFGISFTLRPNWVRNYFNRSKKQGKNTSSQEKRSFQGHHPECLTFQSHTIRWRQKIWCAGCFGLFIGLCGSIILMIFYMIVDFQLTKIIALLLLPSGFFILAVVYIEILHRSKHATVHALLNSFLPLSFFLIIITVGEITGDLVYGLFSILLCFLWLDTRIQLSKSHHRILCRNCVESCKMFTESS
ncbi:MAG TPA: hypothetical protein HA260_07880 [Thermoplasmata archaeon]|nr:hypothetical protein [Thermoplasmata archaeon]